MSTLQQKWLFAPLMPLRESWNAGRKSPADVAPEVGFEPTTNRLTADRSTAELLRNQQWPKKLVGMGRDSSNKSKRTSQALSNAKASHLPQHESLLTSSLH